MGSYPYKNELISKIKLSGVQNVKRKLEVSKSKPKLMVEDKTQETEINDDWL